MKTFILIVVLCAGCSITSGFDDYTFVDPDSGSAGMGGGDATVEAGAGGKDVRDAEPEPDTGVVDTGAPDVEPKPELGLACDTCEADVDCGEGLKCNSDAANPDLDLRCLPLCSCTTHIPSEDRWDDCTV